MSPDLPGGMGSFFPGMFGDLMKLLRTDTPIQWELALQLAQSVAAEGASEANVEPVARIRLEELVRVAELQVADVTGMTTSPGGRLVQVAAATRAEWARRALEGWRWLIEDIARALNPPAPGPQAAAEAVARLPDEEPGEQELAGLFGQWTTVMAPAMIAMQVGSVVGHLAERSLGQYELPLPRRGSEEIVVVPANIRQFAEEWSLPPEAAEMWVAARDVTMHSVLSRPHVAARLAGLLVEHARGFRPDPRALEDRLAEAAGGELPDVAELARLLGDPAALAGVADTPESRRVRVELDALSAVIGGYVEWVTDAVASRTISGRAAVREAMRRRRVERSSEQRVAESLFGMRLDPEHLDRGTAFVRGVLDRGGELELAKLWVVEANLPTPAEVDAPGLWIERVNLPPG